MTQYQLGIDLGTTFTAAAVCRDGGAPEPVRLGGAGPVVPTVVHLADDGALLIGEAAQRHALTDPRRTVREFKRRIGDSTPLLVAGRAVAAADLAARFVVEVVDGVAAAQGGPAGHVVLTHPAEWGGHRRAELAAALAAHGLPGVGFRTEPEAAAVGYASGQRLAPGDAVAVYDLGGGTFDAAVVRRTDDGFALLGSPGGVERLGGVDFDDRVFTHVRESLGPAWDALDPGDPEVLAAAAALRRECTAAKEALSADTEVLVPVMLPGVHTRVRLGRAEFEDMIRPAVVETIEALRRAMDSAGVSPADLRSVLLVGGSSRIPLVSQLLSAELGRSVSVDVDPKAVVAAGAALTAQAAVAPAPAPPSGGPDEPDGVPDAPAVEFAAAPAPVAAPPRRRRALTVAAAVGVAAVFTASAALATGWDALVPGPAGVAGAPAAAVPGGPPVAAPPVDPWTGGAPVGTTPPGPRRPEAVAAAVRPVARNVPTGALGAAPPLPAAAPRAGTPAGPGAAPRGNTGTGAASGTGTTGGGRNASGATAATRPAAPVRPPADGPDRPGDSPTDPVDTPSDPVDTPTDPVDTPTDPVDTPTDPVDTPTDPVDTPTDPVDTPTDPVDTPTDPVDPPSDTPAEPVDPPADPGDGPTDPVDPAADPLAAPPSPGDPANAADPAGPTP